MREEFATRDSHVLVKTPNVRQLAFRRRAVVAGGLLALALVSGVVGALSHRGGEALGEPKTGPFSYLSE
ncbi:hypothetical protein LJR219_000411 [Phenylobacterium sp. LjRoot219]|uniref:hypothetical protein n=1 Tax=Phenylobacterium sp. LjRoot219 TaxID=3342283 RepID=UPI003ECD9B4E